MELLQLAKKRQSDRSYSEKKVDPQIIRHCLEIAHLAPSSINSQPWRFVIVEDEAVRLKLAKALQVELRGNVINKFVPEAPVLIAFCGEKDARRRSFDMGAAVNYFCLAAAEQGLGTCIMGGMNEDEANQALNLPDDYKLEVVVAVGYSNQETREKNRKDLDDMIFYNQFGNKAK